MKRQAVFVDRDGTINEDVHYLDTPERFRMYPTVGRGIRLLNEAGFWVVLITNQSGIARGYFSKETLESIHRRMRRELAAENARLDAEYFCPHHPDDDCACRKPKTGLLEKASREHGIDLSRSFFIGDRMVDVEAGNRAGCRTILIPEHPDLVRKEMAGSSVYPDSECERFIEAVHWVLENSAERAGRSPEGFTS